MIKVNGKLYTRETYPDGTRKMQGEFYAPTAFEEEGYDESVIEIQWFFDSEDEILDLLYITAHLTSIGVHYCLFMPYIPNARNDRVHGEDEVFTLKYFAHFLNNLGFEKVFVLDPHSHVSEALINRVCPLKQELKRLIQSAISAAWKIGSDWEIGSDDSDGPLTLCYPDEGAMKRYTDIVSNPYVFGIKKRDWKTGNILGLDIMGDPALIEGKNVLIVDDICSKGGTFYHTSKKLKEMGAAKVFLYVTHCENTIFDGELLKDNGLIDRIFTTDSIFRGEHEKIEVFKL